MSNVNLTTKYCLAASQALKNFSASLRQSGLIDLSCDVQDLRAKLLDIGAQHLDQLEKENRT